MLKNRVIPLLLLKNDELVKTINFQNPKYVGDPINAIRIFNEKEVDELILIDICASKESRKPNFDLIEKIAGECFMPLTYGGGIRSEAEIDQIFSAGVEKVAVQSSVIQNPSFITNLAKRFGSQSIVVSIDVKKNWLGKPKCFISSKNKIIEDELINLIRNLVNAGAGEVLLNSVEREGTFSGPDLNLISEVSNSINVPMIACGGISSLKDIKACIKAGASAVAAGSFFIYSGPHRAVLLTYPNYNELEALFLEN
jgi:imidazole glycerol-phosphate synthase subunit HisF